MAEPVGGRAAVAGATGSCMDVALLKSWDFSAWEASQGAGQLPYRIDHLRDHGVRLRWTDALHRPGWERSLTARVLRRAEAAAVPFVQAALMAPRIAAAPVTLAMFESEANALAAARRATPGRRRGALVVVSCWLADILERAGPARRAWYRWAYGSVDRLFYLSANQGPVLAEHLGMGPDRLRHVPFGVDHETFTPLGGDDDGYVLVVGRDRGRDWPTLFAAAEGLGMAVKVCCRPGDVAGLAVPAGVEVLGYVERDRYRQLLGRARVVAVASRPVVYPSGQSVLLEAMAMGRAVVVTATAALGEYVVDGVTALAVPAGDPTALRQAVLEAAGDDALRARLGVAGRAAVEDRFNARAMWGAVASELWSLRG